MVSLPATPLERPQLSVETHHGDHTAPYHDSPVAFTAQHPPPTLHHHSHSRLAPSPVPPDFGHEGHGDEGEDDAGSFIDRGTLASSRDGADPALAPLPTPPAWSADDDQRRKGVIATTARIFAQLEVIRDLQADIAGQHAQLEGVAPLSSDGAAAEQGADKPRLAGKSKEEKEKTGKAYEHTASEFAKREKGIEGIMAKLSDLSSALKTFHALPSPVLFPDAHSPTSSPNPNSASPPAASKDKGKSRARYPSVPTAEVPSKSDSVPVPEGKGGRERAESRVPERNYTGQV
ncbi:hypothetical protein JCM8097_000506 [Rhodosporidiobolus ruineniae]